MIANYNFKTKWKDGSPTLFKEQILEGSKIHTIRLQRKNRTSAGDTLQLFTGLRTANTEKFMTIRCVNVRRISIHSFFAKVSINGVDLDFPLIDRLAKNDGFAFDGDFFAFFRSSYTPDQLENDLRLVQWAQTPY